MKFGFFGCLLIATFFTGCQSQKKSNLEEFKKIDSALLKSNTIVESATPYEKIQSQKNRYPELAAHADSIIFVEENAFKFIDSLKEELKQQDPSGEKLDVGKTIIIDSKKSVELGNRLLSVYSSCTTRLDKLDRKMADALFSIAEEIKTDKNWGLKYFDKIPTIGAITMLNKFRNECSTLVMFSLKGIEDKILD